MKQIPVGASAPLGFDVLVTTADPSLDLTTVTGASFSVFREYDQQTAVWSGVPNVTEASASQLMIAHTFTSTGLDVPCLGPYEVTPILTTPAGQLPCTTIPVFAVPLSRYAPEAPGQLPTPAVSYAQKEIGGLPT